MQIKYDINAPDFMIGEHIFCVFSNTNFGFKVVKMRHFSKLVTQLRYQVQLEVHFKIFCK